MSWVKIQFIIFIVVVATIGHISAAIYTPSLPFIDHDFRISSSLGQVSITEFFLGMALPGLFFGYLSDYFGRRKILLVSLSIGSFGMLLCLMAPNIYFVILGRFIQGIGFSGVSISGRAILRDKFSGAKLVRYASNLAVRTSLVIDLSPFIGGVFQQYFGWRSIFILLLIYNSLAIYMCYKFRDNANVVLSKCLNLQEVLHLCVVIFKNKNFLRYNLIAAISYSILMAFLTTATFLFQIVLGLTPSQYGLNIFGLTFVFMLGAFLNGKLLYY